MSSARVMRIAVAGIVAAATLASTAEAAVLIRIDKSTQRMTVAVDGRLRWQWPVSTGRLGYSTPSGTFKAFRLEADHYSKEWDDAPMPHSIFFTRRGHAIHGYLNTRQIGRPASHGCIRLEPDKAALLFALAKQRGVANTTVVLSGSTVVAARRGRTPAAEPVARLAEPAPLPASPLRLEPGQEIGQDLGQDLGQEPMAPPPPLAGPFGLPLFPFGR